MLLILSGLLLTWGTLYALARLQTTSFRVWPAQVVRIFKAIPRPFSRPTSVTVAQFNAWVQRISLEQRVNSSDVASFTTWLVHLPPEQAAAFLRALSAFCQTQDVQFVALVQGQKSFPGAVSHSVLFYSLAIWRAQARPLPRPAPVTARTLPQTLYMSLAESQLIAAPAEVWLLQLNRHLAAASTPFAKLSPAAAASEMGVANVLQKAIGYWRPYWPLATVLAGLMLIEGLYFTGFSLSLKVIIDAVVVSQGGGLVLFTLGVLAVGLLIVFVLRVVEEYLEANAASLILNDLRLALFAHLQRLSLGFYSQNQIGNVLARFTTDLAEIKKGFVDGALDLVKNGLSVALGVAALFLLEWHLALLLLGAFLLAFWWVGRFIAPTAYAAAYRLKQGEGQLASVVQENLRGQSVVQAFNLQDFMLARFQRQLAEFEQPQTRALFTKNLVGVTGAQALWLTQLVVLGLGALFILQGALTIGTLSAFALLLVTTIRSAHNIVRWIVPDLIATGSGLRRIEEVLREMPTVADDPGALPLPRLAQQIGLENVSFKYASGEAVLHQISLTIPAGQFVAFVGPSGAGKTTLLNLLMRLYDPTTGRITFDGQDIRAVTLASLHEQIGVVLQDTFLFDFTIRENLRLARLDATEAEIESAARDAEIHDTLSALPQGYDTPVGEAGAWLSAGQRQRLAIARALLRNPAVLILDEATSALDSITEAAFSATLQRLARERTIIFVTHRLASIAQADCIYVLENGRLVEQGRHTALLGQQGLYARLWQDQGHREAKPLPQLPAPTVKKPPKRKTAR